VFSSSSFAYSHFQLRIIDPDFGFTRRKIIGYWEQRFVSHPPTEYNPTGSGQWAFQLEESLRLPLSNPVLYGFHPS